MDINITISHEGRNIEKNTDLWSITATSGKLEATLEMIDTEWLNSLTIGELRELMIEI